jgi:spoIIIJ-associated protein
MEGREIEGRTIDEAIEKACTEFGVPREKLRVEILCEGTPGFLGLGAKKARIRASLLTIDLSFDAPPPRRERKFPAIQLEKPVTEASSAEKARSILEGLLARMQIESPVSVEETEESIVLNIRGDESGLIIGKRGQNLDAIQYFVNKAVHHSANGNRMIVIDTEEYRKRREESLISLALRLGEKAKQTKKPVTVGHLNAHDRRIVHLSVQNDPTLTTKSRGEGEYRKILILPARRRTNPAGG